MHVAYHTYQRLVGYLFIETNPSPDHVPSLSSPPLTFRYFVTFRADLRRWDGSMEGKGGRNRNDEVVIGGAANKGVWFVPQDGCLAAICRLLALNHSACLRNARRIS